MRTASMVSFSFVLIVFLISASHAQEQPAPARLVAVLEVGVKPGWVPVYDSMLMDLQEVRDEQNTPWQIGPVVSLNESPSYFLLFPPINDLNDVARLQTTFQPKGNEDWDRLITKLDESKNHETWWVLRERRDLSYHPNGHAIVFGKEPQYFSISFFYGECDRKAEIESAYKEWIELYKANEIPYGYTAFEVVLGGELPALVFVYTAADAAEFYKNQKEISDRLSYKEAKMQEKVLKLCRTYSVRTGFYRPELTGWKEW
jgi:hypothetical protein